MSIEVVAQGSTLVVKLASYDESRSAFKHADDQGSSVVGSSKDSFEMVI